MVDGGHGAAVDQREAIRSGTLVVAERKAGLTWQMISNSTGNEVIRTLRR